MLSDEVEDKGLQGSLAETSADSNASGANRSLLCERIIYLMSTKNQSSSIKKTRSYATIVYPDSAPDNWVDILRDMKFNVVISPLHDSDVNPEDGEIKKAHYHVLFLFDGPKTVEQAKTIADKIHGVGIETLNSVRSYARYLCHLDNPEKHQYSPENVVVLGSEDYFSLISLPTDKYRNIRDMIAWCKENNVNYYSDLLLYSMENRDDWFRTLCDNGTYVIKEFFKSDDAKRRKNLSDSEQQE